MDFETMEQDAMDAFKGPSDVDLQSVAVLANRQFELEEFWRQSVIDQVLEFDPSIPELEALLSLKKEELRTIREVDLPRALDQFGLSEIVLSNGSRVKVAREIYTGITQENKAQAMQWLVDTGNDGLIKNEVKLSFGKGQDGEAQNLMDSLNEQGYSYASNKSVHPQTLKAFVKRRIEDGAPIPTDLFSVHVVKVSTVDKSKEKKK